MTMDPSLFLARLFGPSFIVIGCALIFNPQSYTRIATDLHKNAALVYLCGLCTLLMGLAIISFHNLWVDDWRVLITLLGWSALLKGAALVAFPNMMAKRSAALAQNPRWLLIPWSLMLVFGVYLSVKGW